VIELFRQQPRGLLIVFAVIQETGGIRHQAPIFIGPQCAASVRPLMR
jgi:hypothetical protein